jgi:hypothetical protein
LGTEIGGLIEIGFVSSPQESCADIYENPEDLDSAFDKEFNFGNQEV